jgi:hypothetical protein
MRTSGLKRTIAAAIVILCLPLAAFGNQATSVPSQAQSATSQADAQSRSLDRLHEAQQALAALPKTPSATTAPMNDLRRDFEELLSMFNAQSAAGSKVNGTPAIPRPTGAIGIGAPEAAAVGTSGSVASARATDWRMQYAAVNSDLGRILATSTGANAPDDGLRTALMDFQTRLESFYTSTLSSSPAAITPAATTPASATPVTPTQPPASGVTDTNLAQAIVLLQRMEMLLNRQQSDDGRSLKSSGKVTLDRADIDEILAEIQSLRAMLRR